MTLVDAEALTSYYLLNQSEVQTFAARRVYTEIPKNPTWPLVRVTRIGGAPKISRPLYLDKAHLQLEVFGGPKATAFDLSCVCLDELSKLPVEAAVQPLGIVTAVGFGPINAWMPDESVPTEKGKARPRYISDVFVSTRPAPLPTT